MKKINALLGFILALSFFASSATAQYSTTGFQLRGHLTGASWTVDDFDTDAESGGGLGVGLVYGFTEMFSGFLEFDGVQIDPDESDEDAYTLSHVDIGVRAHFGAPASKFKFVALAGYSSRAATAEFEGDEIEISGFGPTVGGGFLYFFNSNLALDVDLMYMFGKIDEVKIGTFTLGDLDVDAKSARLNLGISWFFNR